MTSNLGRRLVILALTLCPLVFAQRIVLEHGDTPIASIYSDGAAHFNQGPVQQASTTPARSGGFLIERSDTGKLWTVGDTIHIAGNIAQIAPANPLLLEYTPTTFAAMLGENGNLYIPNLVDPMADADTDRIVNGIELQLGSDMHDASSVAAVGIPDTAYVVSASRAQVVTYDYSAYTPDYNLNTSVKVILPPGSMSTGSYVPIVELRDTPKDAPVPEVDGFTALGRYFEVAGTINDGATISIAFPFPNRRGFLPEGSVKLLHYTGGSWQSVVPDSMTQSAIYATVSTLSPFLEMVGRFENATVYVDGSTVYEARPLPGEASVFLDIRVNGYSLSGTNVPAVQIETDIGYVKMFRMYPSYTSNTLICEEGPHSFGSHTNIKSVTVYTNSSKYGPITVNKNVESGQLLSITGEWQEGAAATKLAAMVTQAKKLELAYFSIVTPGGTEGRITLGADASESRRYYVRDHLGSVKAVVTDDGVAVEELVYYTYGNARALGTPVGVEYTRERFSGKEFDEEGGINLYYFGRRYFDPDIALWTSRDPGSQFWCPYAYVENPLMFVDRDGSYFWLVPIAAAAAEAAAAGAVAGAVTGAIVAESQGYEWYQGAIVGAGIGAASAGMGSMVGGLVAQGLSATGAGWLAGSAIFNTTISGAVGGAIATGSGGAGTAWAFGGTEGLFTGEPDLVLEALGSGAAIGAITGGAVGALRSSEVARATQMVTDWIRNLVEPGVRSIKQAINVDRIKVQGTNIGNTKKLQASTIRSLKQLSSEAGKAAVYGGQGNLISFLNSQNAISETRHDDYAGKWYLAWMYMIAEPAIFTPSGDYRNLPGYNDDQFISYPNDKVKPRDP